MINFYHKFILEWEIRIRDRSVSCVVPKKEKGMQTSSKEEEKMTRSKKRYYRLTTNGSSYYEKLKLIYDKRTYDI